ncbi:MAG: hypothetical protein U9P10_15790 [Thermodesulfobacteriota bacterium]|nr:hypothetical protein [Thermodesulfobacteriota bacterium]
MTKTRLSKKDEQERQQAFDSLPLSIRQQLDPEEKELFLHGETWPDTLFEKLRELITPL